LKYIIIQYKSLVITFIYRQGNNPDFKKL